MVDMSVKVEECQNVLCKALIRVRGIKNAWEGEDILTDYYRHIFMNFSHVNMFCMSVWTVMNALKYKH